MNQVNLVVQLFCDFRTFTLVLKFTSLCYLLPIIKDHLQFRIGAISIIYVEGGSVANKKLVVMTAPIFHEDLDAISLCDRIKNLNTCVNLYPNTPKYKVFGRFYTKSKNGNLS